MEKLNCVILDGKCCVDGYQNKFEVLDIGYNNPQIIKQYKIMMGHRHDLDRALACLSQMFFSKETSLIDGVLINTAIQLLVRCFSNPSNRGRRKLSYIKVFRKYSMSIGQGDLTEQFSMFYDIRNEVIAHDQNDYQNNLVGLIVEKETRRAVDVADITLRTTYLYKQNQEILRRLITVAQKYTNLKIDELKQNIVEWYNDNCNEVSFSILECPNVETMNIW